MMMKLQLPNYWGKYGNRKFSLPAFDMPKFNLKLVAVFLLIVAIIGLSYWNYKTGKHVEVLEFNNTNLQSNLTVCNKNLGNTSFQLSSCNENYAGKLDQLDSCQQQKAEAADSLSSCSTDLNKCDADYELLRKQFEDTEEDLNRCDASVDNLSSEKIEFENKYNSARNDLNDVKRNYAKDYCCLKNNVASGATTYYKADGNRVNCYTDSTSGGTAITC